MKIATTVSPNIVSDGMTVTEMGVSPKRLQKILGFMRDNIYTDKIWAVVREYNNNGDDEHVKYGISRPVLTGIRNGEAGKEFFVRDFANGLSDQGVREIFAMSGESTKDDSDDEIGGYGIGAKSGLSYGSKTLFVYSYYEGTKTTYCLTLGMNDDGQECGTVADMGREPTQETGIEIVIPVEREDFTKFSNRIRDFISLSPRNIEADILGAKIYPAVPTALKKVGDYTLRLLPHDGQYHRNVLFQMGGNTYKVQEFTLNGAKIKSDHCLIVDIPIGRCTPALNREAFEATTQNENVFAEIDSILSDLSISDLLQFKTKTVFDLVNDSLASLTAYQGDFFQTYAKNLYRGVWSFVESVQLHNSTLPAEKKNGKPICVIIPNNDARQYWKTKIKGYLNDSGRNLYAVTETDWNPQDKAITDSFEFISVRKLPYPKIPKVNGRFAVYQRQRRRVEMIGKFNALELFNHASMEYNWKFEAKTEKEAFDFLAEKAKNVNDQKELECISIRQSEGQVSSIFTVNSVAFASKLESIGFVRQGGIKWQEISKKLSEKREREQKKDSILNSAKKSWVKYNPKTNKAIEKVRHADRVGKFWTAILSEQSLRGKILKKIEGDHYYRGGFTIERHELRKILALR